MTKKTNTTIALMLILFSIGTLFSGTTERIIQKYRFDLSPEYFYYDGGTSNYKYKAYRADEVYGGWEVDPEEILLIYDSSDGKAATGFFITEEAIYYKSKKPLFSKKSEGRIAIENLKTVAFDCPNNGRGSCFNIYLNDIKIKMMTSHNKKDDELLEEMFNDIIGYYGKKRWDRGDISKLRSECIKNRIADEENCTCIARRISKEFSSLEEVYDDPMDLLIIMEVMGLECKDSNDRINKKRRSRPPKKKIIKSDPNKIYDIADAGSIVFGNPHALVTIVQWMDFQ